MQSLPDSQGLEPSNDPIVTDPFVHLLFATHALLGVVHGDKRAYLRRAWVAAATNRALTVMPSAPRLPTDTREAALALHDQVVTYCKAVGISPLDLAAHYTARADAGEYMRVVAPGTIVERMIALVMVLLARRIQGDAP